MQCFQLQSNFPDRLQLFAQNLHRRQAEPTRRSARMQRIFMRKKKKSAQATFTFS